MTSARRSATPSTPTRAPSPNPGVELEAVAGRRPHPERVPPLVDRADGGPGHQEVRDPRWLIVGGGRVGCRDQVGVEMAGAGAGRLATPDAIAAPVSGVGRLERGQARSSCPLADRHPVHGAARRSVQSLVSGLGERRWRAEGGGPLIGNHGEGFRDRGVHVEQQGVRSAGPGEGHRHGDVVLEAAAHATEAGGNEEPGEAAGPRVGHVGCGEDGNAIVLGNARSPRRRDVSGELDQGRDAHASAFLPTAW